MAIHPARAIIRGGGTPIFVPFGGLPFPGQAGDPVGFAATPASQPSTWGNGTWPGAFSSLTAWPGGTGNQTISNGTNATSGSGTSGSPWIFAFYDFNSLTGGVVITASNAVFVGCRFQSNNVNGANVTLNSPAANVNFFYCSFVPLISKWTSPPNAAWPSAGVGQQIVPASAAYTNTGGFCVPSSDGYQFDVLSNVGPMTADHCDSWGFGNSFSFLTTTAQMTVRDCWIHDAANCNVAPPGAGTQYHTDGPGYENGATPPNNVLVKHCTIATIGNTNAIAFQAATSAYSNISVLNNYMTGFGNLIDMCHNATGNNNLTLTDNIIATDIPWIFGPVYTDFSTQFTGTTNLWRRNKFSVYPGTSPVAGSNLAWTSADNGKFVLPNQTLSASDWTG